MLIVLQCSFNSFTKHLSTDSFSLEYLLNKWRVLTCDNKYGRLMLDADIKTHLNEIILTEIMLYNY
jgi:hypothetical protein